MWTFLWGLIQPRLITGLKWLAIGAAVLGVLLYARRAGRDAERVANLERAIDAARTRTRIETRNRARDGGDAAVRERLRKQRERLRGL